MLTEEDFDLFRQFRIKAMGDKLREMVDDPVYDEMSFEERMKVLLDAEAADGTYHERMDALKTVPLLIVDDFMTTLVTTQNASTSSR